MPWPKLRALQRTVEPATGASGVVTVAEVKDYMRVSGTDEDALIQSLIDTCTTLGENYQRRAWLSQQWVVTYDAQVFNAFTIPSVPRAIDIPRPPLVTIDAIKFFLEDDSESAFAVSNVVVDTVRDPAQIFLKDTKSWPTGLREQDALHIEFTAGKANAAALPAKIKDATKIAVATLFEHREELTEDKLGRLALPVVAKTILHPGPFGRVPYLA